MGAWDDYFNNPASGGSSFGGVGTNTVAPGTAAGTGNKFSGGSSNYGVIDVYPNSQIIDSKVDQAWGGSYHGALAALYYDYYYTGQDMIILVDGTEDDSKFKSLPLINIGYSIAQQKVPVFGFWSYTYDAMMRGNRIVQGQFTLAVQDPHYMIDLLSKAAQARSQRSSKYYNYPKPLTEDDANIALYWSKNIDPAITDGQKNLFSVHPPFSLVLIYGIQSVSINSQTSQGLTVDFNTFSSDNAWYTDINERLVDSTVVDQSKKVVIDACEITNMETGIGPEGQVVCETYSFIARDYINNG